MRRWLSLYALAITSIVILAFLVPLAILIKDLAADRAMSSAEREAQTIARFAATIDGGEQSIQELDSALSVSGKTSLVLSDGSLLGAGLPEGIDLGSAQQSGQAYRQRLADGQAVVVPVFRGDGIPWVAVVAVSGAELTKNVQFAWVVLGSLGLVLVVLALFVADRLGRAVVEPIGELVDATHRLGRGELTVTVDPAGPHELAEVGAAFNTLTDRVSTLMDRERETAADISHRLRTPLTALKLDIEALQSQVDVDRLQRDVDELERVVSHVISEARRSVREGGGVVTDLGSVVAARVRYWGFLAEDQGRDWTLDIESGSFPVGASEPDAEAMLDALLENIFAHTPPGTSYRVRLVRTSGSNAELVVADDGPGISDVSLLERGTSGGGSTGLGADIILRTAEGAGGSAEWLLGTDSGTTVRIVVPLVAGPR